MSEVRLGEGPAEDAERDAIHVAVIPAVAGTFLSPGARVGMRDGRALPWGTHVSSAEVIGIVDPYRFDAVAKGDRFWLCLLPGGRKNVNRDG